MKRALTIVSGVFCVLLCIDKPYVIPYAIAGAAVGLFVARVVHANTIKDKGK